MSAVELGGRGLAIVGLVVATALGGCGGAARRHPRPVAHREPAAVAAPARIELRLAIPLVGLSGAPRVSYASQARHPLLVGAVSPATTTVYVDNPNGTRTAIDPRADGSFSLRASLLPGANVYDFTAAHLGSASASARLAVAFRGPAAAALERQIQNDPAKYLAPASAGLNRPIPSLPQVPTSTGTKAITVTFSLQPIDAPPPPTSGGTGHWLGGFELTEYYPALESWFKGALVSAPGLPGKHRIDWLYSAEGLSMEGDGIGLDGKPYHIASLGSGGWLTANGRSTAQFGNGALAPYWRDGGFWHNSSGALTFPFSDGAWSNGSGVKYVSPPAGISFAPGQSRPLAYLRSVAVDPSVIPLGSHIFIPAYQSINGGWFEADDTGGAIDGRHIDVYVPPPSNPNDAGPNGLLTGQRAYIVPPGKPIP
jgi:3D domain